MRIFLSLNQNCVGVKSVLGEIVLGENPLYSLYDTLSLVCSYKYFQFLFPKEKGFFFAIGLSRPILQLNTLIQPDFCRSDFVQISGYSNKTSGGAVSQGAGHHNNQIPQHSLMRGVLIQSCPAGAKNFPNYVFCHVQFNSPGQSSKNHCANKAKF